MTYFFLDTNQWFNGPLCCRYLVVRFDKVRLPTREGRAAEDSDWYWALGFFTDGHVRVLGAWRDDGAGTPERIAAELLERGIERIGAIAAEAAIVNAMAGLRAKAGTSSATGLVESGTFGPRMQRAIRWTDAVGRHLQARMGRVVKRQAPFEDRIAASDFIAQAMQRAERDLLLDRWDGSRPAPCGQAAFVASLASTA